LRNSSTGAFQAYYISGNNIVGSTNVGAVGLEWNFAGIGNFDGASSLSELLLRNVNSGSFELYHVAGGGVLSGQPVAPIGNNVQVKGFGDFSGVPTTQMMMQDTTGTLWLYTYNPAIGFFSGQDVGKVGSNVNFIGCANLVGDGETRMETLKLIAMMRASRDLAVQLWARSARRGWSMGLPPTTAELQALARMLSSCRRWRASAAARPTPPIPCLSRPKHPNRRF
jgi:hypothetical protein